MHWAAERATVGPKPYRLAVPLIMGWTLRAFCNKKGRSAAAEVLSRGFRAGGHIPWLACYFAVAAAPWWRGAKCSLGVCLNPYFKSAGAVRYIWPGSMFVSAESLPEDVSTHGRPRIYQDTIFLTSLIDYCSQGHMVACKGYCLVGGFSSVPRPPIALCEFPLSSRTRCGYCPRVMESSVML